MARARKTRRAGRGVRALVALWADLFARHDVLTYASAIAFQTLVALVPLVLFGLGLLGALGEERVWFDQVAPAIAGHLTRPAFDAIDFTVQKIFRDDSTGLLVFAGLLMLWEISGSVRACMGGMNKI